MNNNEKMKQLLSLNQSEGLKLSIYLPTHRTSPENKTDLIVFKNLKSEAVKELEERLSGKELKQFTDQLDGIQSDMELFNTTLEGLGIFMTQDEHQIVRVSQPLQEKVVLAKNFYLLPLLEYEDKYQSILALDLRKDSYNMHRVDRYGTQEIKLDVIDDFRELYDDFDADSNLNFSSQGSFHGHRSSGEEIDNDKIKYFRYLDREFKQKLDDKENKLVVFGTTENVNLFKKMSDLSFEIIDKPFKDHSQHELGTIVSQSLDKVNQKRRSDFEVRLAHGYEQRLVSNDQKVIKADLEAGKVDTLVLKNSDNPKFDKLVLLAKEKGTTVHFLDTIDYDVIALNRY